MTLRTKKSAQDIQHEERRLQQIMDELAQVCTRVSKTCARVDVRTQRS